MRTAAFLLALVGSVVCGALGLFLVGSTYARLEQVDRIEQIERSGARMRAVATTGLEDAEARARAAGGLLGAMVLGGLGAGFTRRRPKVAIPLLLAAGAAPPVFALWALCPSSPFLLGALLAFVGRDEPLEDAEATSFRGHDPRLKDAPDPSASSEGSDHA
ncbi:MAG: hypothetical protein KF901_10440 [Myxococcales bacterium]|nr:hypothetical protein [Myxococcales bacterium]